MLALGLAALLLFTLVVVEATALVASLMLARRGVFYSPPDDLAGFDEYMAERDPLLGWPAPRDFGGEQRDLTGSRYIPDFIEPGGSCVSLYGDSFTWGSTVTAEEAWSNQLSRILGCRVANYGVGAYGTDQALLRFEQNVDDEAGVVVLAHLSENVMRNVNRVRRMLYPKDRWGFKPRFLLAAGGGLELLSLDVLTRAELERKLAAADWPHEYFVPDGPSGVLRLRFPFTRSLVRALGHFHVRRASISSTSRSTASGSSSRSCAVPVSGASRC